MPLPFLVRVEILDTPGFNAPDPRHTAVARGAFEEADAAIWLLDATQPMKQSERAVLEEAKRAQLPVQMLVNKADRLGARGPGARDGRGRRGARRDGHRRRGRRRSRCRRRRRSRASSGDAQALEESGWAAAQALLDERIVARSDELKERALRRRAARVVARLDAQAEGEADAAARGGRGSARRERTR